MNVIYKSFEIFSTSISETINNSFNIFSPSLQKVNETTVIPFFQPIICCIQGRLIGLEVFARIRDKKRGIAYFPSKLINNQTTLKTFNKITEELLKRTLTIISMEQFKVVDGCFINLNLSPKQLGDKATLKLLSFYSEKFSFHGYKLNIEITETHEITNYDIANEFIAALSEIKIDAYLDDYGKGFSSPLLLKHLSIDGIKIDKGFIYNIEQCCFSKNFILQTVQLAKDKGLKVIVEGIETSTQYQIISELGVDYTQGYLHGKPAPLHFIDDYYSRFIYCDND